MGLFSKKRRAVDAGGGDAAAPTGEGHRARLVLVRVGPTMPHDVAATTKAVMDVSGRSMRDAKALVDTVRRGGGEQVVATSGSVEALEDEALRFATIAVVRVEPIP